MVKFKLRMLLESGASLHALYRLDFMLGEIVEWRRVRGKIPNSAANAISAPLVRNGTHRFDYYEEHIQLYWFDSIQKNKRVLTCRQRHLTDESYLRFISRI
jgi:hypothetical protein